MAHVLIIGSGFAGLNATKVLAGSTNVKVTLIDQNNYHLFQPLLYQVATAGLSPAEIAVPIRSIFSKYKNIKVLQDLVHSINVKEKVILSDSGKFHYDYLILACGSSPFYFGNEEWEEFAPGLKTVEQATEIRRRVLTAFEKAEVENNIEAKGRLLTFVIVGGGTTGVELAGALAELSHFTFAKEFKHIDPKLARIILIEAHSRILSSFSEKLSVQATRDLLSLGVQVWTSKKVTGIHADCVDIGDEKVKASTIIWAAGIRATSLNRQLESKMDSMGRVFVEPDLSLKDHPEVFVAGDQAHVSHHFEKPLEAIAPVALQQGRFIAKNILRELMGKPRKVFQYSNKGQLATIGRSKAVLEIGELKLSGMFAWVAWLFVHIYSLIGFRNRLFVLLQWAFSYITYKKGARLIVNKSWRFYDKDNRNL